MRTAFASFYASPSVCFALDLIAYVFFLLFLSFTAIVGFSPSVVKCVEVLLCVWVGAYIAEEIRQVCASGYSNLAHTRYLICTQCAAPFCALLFA